MVEDVNWKITFWNLSETLYLGTDCRHLVAVYPKWRSYDKGHTQCLWVLNL